MRKLCIMLYDKHLSIVKVAKREEKTGKTAKMKKKLLNKRAKERIMDKE